MSDIDAEQVRVLLSYCPETGVFRWRVNRGPMAIAGNVAGSPNTKGYWDIGLGGRLYKAHRLAWLYVFGEWPPHQVDHRDGNRRNNAIANLRLATNQQNQANRGPQRNNTSGHKGVSWHRRERKWVAQMKVNGRKVNLGQYADFERACEAYRAAALRTQGEFAPFS
jgi:hypothetical protein